MATSSPYAMSDMRVMVASDPLIKASSLGSNLTGVHVSDDRQTCIVTHPFLRKTECSKAYFTISSRSFLLSFGVLLSPKKCDDGALELELCRAD